MAEEKIKAKIPCPYPRLISVVYDDPVIHFRDASMEAAGKPNLLQVNGYLYQETESHYVMVHEVDVGDGTNEPIWSQVPKACVKAVYWYDQAEGPKASKTKRNGQKSIVRS
jgi:hypothetical protein